MFNASWVAPNEVTQKISINNNRQSLLDRYSILPQIPQRNQYITTRQPKLSLLSTPQKQFLEFEDKQILQQDKKNWFLMNKLQFPNEQDVDYLSQQLSKLQELQEQINQMIKVKQTPNSRQNSVDVKLNKIENNEKKRSESVISATQEILAKKSQSKRKSKYKKLAKSSEIYEDLIENQQSISNSQTARNIQTKENNLKQSYRMRHSLYRKQYQLKKFVILIIFIYRLSKNMNILNVNKKINQEFNTNRLKECEEILSQHSIRQQAQLEKQYFLLVGEKVIHFLKSKQFINECLYLKNMSEKMVKDIHSTNIYKFTTLLFDNIALYTQKKLISPIVYSMINKNIHEDQKMPCSQYIGLRCHFINLLRPKIPKEHLLLIGLEYYMFNQLIPILLDAINEFPQDKKIKFNSYHLSECFYYVFVFAAIIQKKVIQLDIKKVKNPNGNLKSRILDITQQNNQIIKAIIDLEDRVDEDEGIIAGLNTYDLIDQLENQRQKWKDFIDTKFTEISMNIINLLKI